MEQPPPPHQLPEPIPIAEAAAAAADADKPRNRNWDENYAELLTFKAMHGHCDVPLNHKNDRILAKWVAHLRESSNQSQLSKERRDALLAIGFSFSPHEQKWIEMFDRLKAFKQSEGHCKVPTNWKPDRKLGKWVMRQREKRKNGILPDDRLEKLESIGFVWKVHKVEQNKVTRKSQHIDDKWQTKFQALVKYKEEHNNTNVPKVYDPDPQLGKWVQEQRVMFQRSLLKPERRKLLEDIGFVFSYRAQKIQKDWNQMYELLKNCCETTAEGQFKVTSSDATLNRWVQRQKDAYRNYRMDPGREVLLNRINFPFPERPPPKAEERAATLPTHNPFAQGDVLCAEPTGLSLLLGQPASITAHLGIGPAATGATHKYGDSDKLIGRKVANGVDVLAKCMGISAKELAERLALSGSKAVIEESSAEEGAKLEDTDTSQANEEGKDESHETPVTKRPPPQPLRNAFSQLLPKIVALRDDVIGSELESCLREGSKYLESVIRKEKGWDPRPAEGDLYDRLLALAIEMGVLLTHGSERCQSIIRTCEVYFDKIHQKATKKKDDSCYSYKYKAAWDDDEDDVANRKPKATKTTPKRKASKKTNNDTEPELQLELDAAVAAPTSKRRKTDDSETFLI